MDYTPGYLQNSMSFGRPAQAQNQQPQQQQSQVTPQVTTPDYESTNGTNYSPDAEPVSVGTTMNTSSPMNTATTSTGTQTPTIENSGLVQGTNQTISPTLNISRYPTMSNLFNFQRTR
jgi:hypothetical protein